MSLSVSQYFRGVILRQTCFYRLSNVVFQSVVDPIGATVCYNRAVFPLGVQVKYSCGRLYA